MRTNVSPKLFALFLLATLAGCVLLERLSAPEPAFGFNHAIHVQEGLECLDCHLNAEDADDPGMPVLAQCMLCHEDIDSEKPEERRIAQLFDGTQIKRTNQSVLTDDMIFSHQRHVQNEEECTVCHAGIDANVHLSEQQPLGMEDCMACHAAEGKPNECATCHREIGPEWQPGSHSQNWQKLHGQAFRADAAGQANNCALCHTESTCTTCHQEVAPDTHTNFWRRRGHSVEARLDRATCATCHRSDFCSRCHEETLPITHKGMWGEPRDTHCLTCHFPLAAEGCFTCHKSAPSHLDATPLPDDPPHSPGLNCRQCHGLNAPLPHVDKGDECVACHR